MKAFEVSVNGRRMYVAGLPAPGRMHLHLLCGTRPADPNRASPGGPVEGVHLHVGGTDPATGDHVGWSPADLAVGDEVMVRVVDVPTADAPASRLPRDPDWFEQYERKMYEKLKEKFEPGLTPPPGTG